MKYAAIGIFAAIIFVPLLLPHPDSSNPPSSPVILENDDIIVEKIELKSGRWSGEHPHKGKHLAVALDDVRMLFRENGEEREVILEEGDVIWNDPIESHDHKPLGSGTVLLITLK